MPPSTIPGLLCLPSCPDISHTLPEEKVVLDDPRSLQSRLGENSLPEQISLFIEKSKYRLTVFDQGQPVKSYRMVLGPNPTGDKQREGDLKTPEGLFRIRDLYPHPTWSKFIWLDYPTPQSWKKHFLAKVSGDIGLLDSIGGQVGIHGVPSNAESWIESQKNWTWGCVSLTNSDVDEIYSVIGKGTVVEIVP